MRITANTPRLLGAAAIALTLGACASITDHKGYINDEVLIASVQPGLDNRKSVEGALGQPTLKSQFGEQVWYYVASRTKQAPFGRPRIDSHNVLAVRFNDDGTVKSATRSGMEQVVRLDPDGDATPTLGRERSFFDDLFGNIGTVGTAGAGGGGVPR